jgi:ADP-heptose:LPS heptosyltransferase
VLHLGASGPERRWPVESFTALARALRDERLVTTGTLQDLPGAVQVAQAGRIPPQRQLVGWLDLPALAATVAAARLVVTGDTGVAHLASAYGVPSVVVFGPASVKRWGPPELDRHRVVRAHGKVPLARDVEVEEVLEHVTELLALPYRAVPAPRHPAVLHAVARPDRAGALAARSR